jgi:very-short-patch-repair endonuclease
MRTIDWPFRAAEALDSGALTFRELRRFHASIFPGVWAPRGVDLTAIHRAKAAWLWSRRRAVLAGLSASAMLGAQWIEPELSAELIDTNRRPPPLIAVHSDDLAPGETQPIDGMAVTTPARTAFDIGRRLRLEAGVQRIDAVMKATDLKVVDVEAVARQHPGVRGLRQLRQTLDLVDGGSESPYESLTRLMLVQAGFPRPQTQIRVLDSYGLVFAIIDMGWEEWRVGVDFEGAQHWTDSKRRNWDVERYAVLPELGWIDVRLTSGMLHNNPRRFLDRVGAALISRGCPKTW